MFVFCQFTNMNLGLIASTYSDKDLPDSSRIRLASEKVRESMTFYCGFTTLYYFCYQYIIKFTNNSPQRTVSYLYCFLGFPGPPQGFFLRMLGVFRILL